MKSKLEARKGGEGKSLHENSLRKFPTFSQRENSSENVNRLWMAWNCKTFLLIRVKIAV